MAEARTRHAGRSLREFPLTELEQAALKVRHSAAIEALSSPTAPEGWRLLAEIVAPSEPVKLASERRARELLASSHGHVEIP